MTEEDRRLGAKFSEGELRQVLGHVVNAVHHSKQFVHLNMRECYI